MNNPKVATLQTDHSNDLITFTKLGDTMRHGIDPPAQLIPDLLYERGIHSIYSPGGTGKTILALWCAVQAMRRKLHVIYCDEENGFGAIAELLQCYGADDKDVDTYIHYAEFPHLTSKEVSRWARTVQAVSPSLVVFDSFADMLALEDHDENNSVHITQWIKHFAEPVKQSGGAVLLLDHVNKAGNGTGARGSTAKLAKVDVAWQLSSKKPFDRRTTTQVTLDKDKDRMGCLPKKRSFTIGGDGDGNLTVESCDVVISKGSKESGLRPAEYKALGLLIPGMTRKEWEAKCDDKGIPVSTFKPAVSTLKKWHVFEDQDKRYWPRSVDEEDKGCVA